MLAKAEGPFNGADTVFIDGSRLRGDLGLFITFQFMVGQGRTFQERNPVFPNSHVTRVLGVTTDGIGQPQEIIGETGSDSIAGLFMPPVLDVAL